MKKNYILSICLTLSLAVIFFAFTTTNKSTNHVDEIVQYEYMQINTLESVVSGGLGRSRLIITRANGKADKPVDMENYYSAIGINFGNIAENEEKIVVLLNLLGKEGWEVVGTTSGGNQVYFTKYTLKRAKQ
ncbi:hypothetical protein ACE193_24890 [Bernardetia sp. OM2101]|uniref:hypothetical protein n=1 Tax=Bernardetia sp. OM2101 TaxID=3344876 RepID=UPI0035D09292